MGSVSHPPHFDGDNYAAWKAKMKSFLWALDDRVWLAVEEGWEPPTVEETKGEGQSSVTISMLKPRKVWSEDERNSSTFNQRALNALFTAVSPEQFNYISKCSTAKEAWDILEVTHEGNSTVKESKLQNLITQFENIKMLDDESFSDFYAKLSVIVNGCHNLGDSIPEHRVVKKILRSLPSRFHAKRTAIEESKDLNIYKLEQLIGSLQTYESDFTEVKKGKNVAFKVNNEKVNEDSFENLTQDEFALLTKQARKFLKLRSSRGRENRNNFDSNSKVPRSRDFSHGNSSKFVKLGEKKSSNDRDKCFECQGYGHHAHECANTLKKLKDEKNKALTSTWSDSDSEKDTESEDDKEVVAFFGTFDGYETDDSEVEEPDSVEVLQKYTALYDITMKVKKENEELKNKLVQLESEKNEAEIEHQSQMEHAEKLRESMLEKLHMLASDNKGLENELSNIKKKVEEFSIGSSKIDKMLSYGKISGDKSGLGFDITGSSSTSVTKFVKALQEPSMKVSSDEPFGNSCITTKESNFVRNFVGPKKFIRSKNFIPICHFCEKIGHIRPRCYKLQKENKTKTSWISEKSNLKGRFVAHPKGMNRISKIMPNFLTPNLKQVWRRKKTQICLLDKVSPSSEEDNFTCLVAFTALSSCQSDTWYLDSGCSRHMTGDKRWFTSFTEDCKNGAVTFGDGKRARIVGKGEIKTLGIPCLKNVMLVDGLKANLISISQICDDDDAEVLFNKLKCSVKVAKEVDSFEGKRSKDNCYCVNANELHVSDICNKATDDILDLWHKRLGHMNCKDLIKLSKKEYVRGLPMLTGELGICGECQVGKQTKSAHKSTNYISTSRPLELMHMDLVGPVQTESIGGKKYILVLVDDFSRFTWVAFLREKSDAFTAFFGLLNKIQNDRVNSNDRVVKLRTDHGTEFENISFSKFCDEKGIDHNFSAPITPQQNGVVERKNRVLLDMSRVMLTSARLAKHFWAEAVSTACYTANRVYLRPGTKCTPYEIWKGKKPNVKHLRVFGSICYIYRDREMLAKFDSRSDIGIFIGYSITSRAYRVFNKRTQNVMESINVIVNDSLLNVEQPASDEEFFQSKSIDGLSTTQGEVHQNIDSTKVLRKGHKQVQKDHSKSDIIGDVEDQMLTRSKTTAVVNFTCYISKIEPKNAKEALLDDD
ncbi:uncharacterized protein [Pyrus communis]|uniref:uncharacterized protein n=1 Tax=Pyrus communis TaxID=23211 RepID=UPI0035BFA199